MEWQQDRNGIWGLWVVDPVNSHRVQTLPAGEEPPSDGYPQYASTNPVQALTTPDTGGFTGSAAGSDAGNAANGMGATIPDIGGALQSWLDWLKSLFTVNVNVMVPWLLIGGAVVVIYAASHSGGRRR